LPVQRLIHDLNGANQIGRSCVFIFGGVDGCETSNHKADGKNQHNGFDDVRLAAHGFSSSKCGFKSVGKSDSYS
ncbi:MAG: hypothetical protein OQK02_11490, partial [Marinobacter sp.]|nr:hypothetical protein [Marinobacter sp.]